MKNKYTDGGNRNKNSNRYWNGMNYMIHRLLPKRWHKLVKNKFFRRKLEKVSQGKYFKFSKMNKFRVKKNLTSLSEQDGKHGELKVCNNFFTI